MQDFIRRIKLVFQLMSKSKRNAYFDRIQHQNWTQLLDNKSPLDDWAKGWMDANPLGDAGTKNIINREKWLHNTLSRIPDGKKILDAGAGELQYRKFCRHLNYISQDFAQYDGTGDSAGLQMGSWDNSHIDIVSDITKIPVENESFDAVMCIEVLEHVPHPIQAIRELSRILRGGGKLIITVPVSSLTHFAPYYFYNGYSRYFFEKVLEDHNLKLIEMSFNGNYFEYLAQEIRRLDEMALKYSIKKSPSRIETISRHVLIRRLGKLSKRDRGSAEILSHGIHLVAEKL